MGTKKGRHPDKALTAVQVRSLQKPGRYADGNGLYVVVEPSGPNAGCCEPSFVASVGTWAWVASASCPWPKLERRRLPTASSPVKGATRWLSDAMPVRSFRP